MSSLLLVGRIKPGRDALCRVLEGEFRDQHVFMTRGFEGLEEEDVLEALVSRHEYPRGTGQLHTKVEATQAMDGDVKLGTAELLNGEVWFHWQTV